MEPMITTIIPTYRRPRQLRRAIASVLAQSYAQLQVCVYDNDSGDDTEQVVRELARSDPRVRYHRHAENIGSFANFNFGLNAVATPFFSFLSDDDVLLPEFYQSAMAGLAGHPEAAFWGGTGLVMSDAGELRDATDWSEGYHRPPDGLLDMIGNNYLLWASVLFRRGVIDAVGPLDGEVGSPIDIDFLLRVAARLPYLTSPQPAAIWTSHPESSTVMADLRFIWPGWLKTIANVADDARLPAEVRSRVRELLTAQLQRQLFEIGCSAIRQGRHDEAGQVARLLGGQFGQPGRARLLAALAASCRWFPPTSGLFSAAMRLRAATRPGAGDRHRNLQEKFGQYSRLMVLP